MPTSKRFDRDYLLYRTGAAIARAVPESVLYPAAEALGKAAGRRNADRRAVVSRNLARVVGSADLENVVDKAFASYSRYWMETLRIPAPGPREVALRTTVSGAQHLTQFRDAGTGVIFVTPHLGNWDIAGMWLASQGFDVIAIAERAKPESLWDLFVELRKSAGVQVYPLGEASSARAILSGLRSGAAAGLVSDRDISGSGIEVEFFGEQTWLPTGPAVLASRLGVPIVPGAVLQRPKGRYHAVLLEPIIVERGRGGAELTREITERVARSMETLIRMAPEQWHLFQPNWPSDPGYKRGLD